MDSVAHAMRRLTPEQREAIELRFFAGLSAKEAAEAMGRQEGTVRGLQFRAIAALRRELGIATRRRSSCRPGLGDDPVNEDEMELRTARGRASSSGQLARYARVRLDPSPAQVRRARAAVMEAAWRRHLEPDATLDGRRRDDAAASRGRATRRAARPFAGWGVAPPRRLVRRRDRSPG